MNKVITKTLLGASVALIAGCATSHHHSHEAHAIWTRWEQSDGGNGHWFKAVLQTNGITWAQAAAAARAEGGYLATITSAAENSFVFGLVNKSEFFAAANGLGPLLGASQATDAPEPAGGWQWVTGEPWGYTNWRGNQPDNFAKDDKLQFFSDKNGQPAPKWGDVSADWKSMGYVIERDAKPTK